MERLPAQIGCADAAGVRRRGPRGLAAAAERADELCRAADAGRPPAHSRRLEPGARRPLAQALLDPGPPRIRAGAGVVPRRALDDAIGPNPAARGARQPCPHATLVCRRLHFPRRWPSSGPSRTPSSPEVARLRQSGWPRSGSRSLSSCPWTPCQRLPGAARPARNRSPARRSSSGPRPPRCPRAASARGLGRAHGRTRH